MEEDHMKIVVLDGYTLNPGDLTWAGLEKQGAVTVYDRTPAEMVVERIGDADIIFTNKTVLGANLLKQVPHVKYIGVLATGYNVVDVDAAKELGMVVTNIPTYGTSAVSQFAFALLLEICHHVGAHSDAVHQGDWVKCPDFCFWNYPLIELAGKTLGIIGYGRIGQDTGKIAQAFGMKVLAFDAYKNPALECDTMKYVELDELYAQSDIISLHCPLFDSTKGMINQQSISKMKDGVILINTSRGPLVVEEDLRDALNSCKVAMAGLDVVSSEPIKQDNPLLSAKNCIITPHIAWAPKESRSRLMQIAVDNLDQFLAGTPVNVVNQ
jgi:glycerate dehydrogenase